jgi:hypothetical protein
MTGEYPAHLAVWYNMFGHLASAGLTWNDVKVVPVPAVNEGVDALVQGRADVTEFALNGAKVKEADAAVGVRHISIDCSPEGEKRLRASVPGYYPRIIKAGTATAVVEDTCVIAYDLHLRRGGGGVAARDLGERGQAAADSPGLPGVDPRAGRGCGCDHPLSSGRHPLLQGARGLEGRDGSGAAEAPLADPVA